MGRKDFLLEINNLFNVNDVDESRNVMMGIVKLMEDDLTWWTSWEETKGQ